MCENCNVNENRPSGLTYESYADRVVKAHLSNTEDDVNNVIDKILNKTNMKSIIAIPHWENMSLKDTYRGVAKLNITDGDVFNLEKGQDLAKARCLDKYHKNFDKKMSEFLRDIRELEATTIHYCMKKGISINSVPSVEEIAKKKFSGVK